MAQEFFDPVLFIKEDAPTSVDLSQTPFFCNIHGYPHYCAEPPTGLKVLEPAISNPEVAIGTHTVAPEHVPEPLAVMEPEAVASGTPASLTARLSGTLTLEADLAPHTRVPWPGAARNVTVEHLRATATVDGLAVGTWSLRGGRVELDVFRPEHAAALEEEAEDVERFVAG